MSISRGWIDGVEVQVNRATAALEARVAVAGGATPGTAPVYRFDGATTLAPAGSVAVSGGAEAFTIELPPRSVTLVAARAPGTVVFADGFETGDLSAWVVP